MKKRAKIITIIITIIVSAIVLLVIGGAINFSATIEKEKNDFFGANLKPIEKITEQDLQNFPPVMKTYLQKVGVIGKYKNRKLSFKQKGKIKTSQKKGWTNFTATQYMTAAHPGFIWTAKAFPMFIRDRSIMGKGEVKLSLLGLRNIAVFNDDKTDQSALGRCFGELAYYPIGFLSKDIFWEELNEQSVKATIIVKCISTTGIFYFDDEGLIERFETQRYRGDTLEKFTGKALDYKTLDGLLVPTKMVAIWNLPEGDLEYFKATITDYKIE